MSKQPIQHPDISTVETHRSYSHSHEELYEMLAELEYYKLYLEYKNYSEEDFNKFKQNFKKIRGY